MTQTLKIQALKTQTLKPFVSLVLAASLAACASPSPQMMRGQKFQAKVAGSSFTIWRSGDAVEIYRTSPEMIPRLSEVMAKASVAVSRVTGCAVKQGSLAGDAALMTAKLDCG